MPTFRQHLPSDGGELLSGVVAVDEAWFGKQCHSKRGKQTIVMDDIEVGTRRLRLQDIPDTKQDSIELFLETWVARGSHLITDAHASYNGVEWLGYSREAYNHSTGHFGMSNHIECIWSAMKRHLRKLMAAFQLVTWSYSSANGKLGTTSGSSSSPR